MKKVLSLVLVLVLVLGSMPMAFADQHMTAGEQLKEYGLVQGDESGDLMEDKTFTRAEMMVMLARLNNVEDDAQNEIPTSFTDVEGHWAKNYIAYAELQGWTNGVGDNKFAPESSMTEQMVATLLLRVLGYEGNWDTAVEDAKALGIMNDVMSDPFVRADAFDMMLDALSVKMADSDMTLGVKLGVMEAPVEEVAIEEAVAINSMVVEVALDEDMDAPEEINASVFTVTDEDDEELAIDKAEFAGWDSDNYTVLVWLDDDTVAGELYTIASGDTAVNFGGQDVDEDEPTFDDASTEYDEVTLEFSEAVVLETLEYTVSEKYGDKDDLAVLDMEYGDNGSEIVLITEEQTDATLYEVEVTAIEDFAGNNIDEDTTKTFVGEEFPTDDNTVVDATATDYNKVEVEFEYKMDAATVSAEDFDIAEKYGDKDEIAVLEAEVDEDDETLVILTVEELSDSVLYELEANDVLTVWGQELDTDENTVTFVGTDRPSDPLAISDVESISNTEVDVTFEQPVDTDTVDIDDFEIAEKYGDKDELAVLDFEVKEDGNDEETIVRLTTESQDDATLYEMTINDLSDIYGNEIDTDDDANIQTFVGSGVADAIEAIDSIKRKSNTEIVVNFDQNVGDNATDVSLYYIDRGIGYPKDVDEGDNADEVILTIPKTENGKVYELTVYEGIENADGVESEDDITESFAGKGETAEDPSVEAAMVVNNQMIKVYFDQPLEDIYTTDVDDFDLSFTQIDTPTETNRYEDPTDENALIFVASEDDFKTITDYDTVDLTVSGVTLDEDTVEVALNDDDATKVAVEGIIALNTETIKVYFNQYVEDVGTGDAEITKTDDSSVTPIDLDNAVALNDERTEWEFSLDDPIDADSWTLNVTDEEFAYNGGIVYDTADYDELEFAGTDNADFYIDDVYAVMTDENHIEVYYPEAMDESTDTSIYTNEEDEDFDAADVDWSDDGTVATLTFDGSDYTWASDDEDTLTIESGSLSNQVGNKDVEDEDGNDLEIDFAVSDKDAPEVAIDDLSIETQDTTPSVVEVEFDQVVDTSSAAKADFVVYVNGDEVTDFTVSESGTNSDALIDINLTNVELTEDDVVEIELTDDGDITGIYDGEPLEDGNSMTIVVE